MIEALTSWEVLEEDLTLLEAKQAILEKQKEGIWADIFAFLDKTGTDRVVVSNGMILARVAQHRTSYNENAAHNILPSSEWPRITKRVIDPLAYERELQGGHLTPEQDAQIRIVTTSWVRRHQPATKQELRELKGEKE